LGAYHHGHIRTVLTGATPGMVRERYAPSFATILKEGGKMRSIMPTLLLSVVICSLVGCTVDPGSARYDRSTGYSDWPHFQTLDRWN
jgi:hypothetical protein